MKKSELRRLIKEELLKEYVRDEPEISKSYDAKTEKEKKEIMNK